MDNFRFLCMHRVRVALSQVKALWRVRPGRGIPRISTAYAQVGRSCAQVIHMFVHRQHAGHEDLPRGWKRSPEKAGARMLAAACRPGAASTASPPDPRILIGPRTMRPRYAQAAQAMPLVTPRLR